MRVFDIYKTQPRINNIRGGSVMRQKKIVAELYKACFEHDQDKIANLRKGEFVKIFARKQKGKLFTPRWIMVQI